MSSLPMESLDKQKSIDEKLKFNSMEMKEMEKHEEEEEEATWSSELYNFCQNTTIHGLKQITEPTPFTLRRSVSNGQNL